MKREGGGKEEEEDSYLSLGSFTCFHSRLSWRPSGPAPVHPEPSAARLVYCPIMTLSTATIRRLIAKVSAATMAEWRRNGKANSSRCHLEVFGGALLLARVCR